MRAVLVFIGALGACSGGGGAPRRAVEEAKLTPTLAGAVSAAGTERERTPAAPVAAAEVAPVAAAAVAATEPTPCGRGEACDGACVETPRAGQRCMPRCATTADCRAAEGYTCDPAWGACLLPHTAALRLRACPSGTRGVAPTRRVFGAAMPLAPEAPPADEQREPAITVVADGSLVALYAARGADHAGDSIAIARVPPSGAVAAPQPAALPAGGAIRSGPQLARSPGGALYAVWVRATAGGPELALAASRDDGASWSAPRAVHDPRDCTGDPACLDAALVAAGPDPAAPGGALVYVLYGAGGGLRVRASRDGGASFGPARIVLRGTRSAALVGADGRLHVAALTGGSLGGYGSAARELEYTSSADGGATFAPVVRASLHEEVLPWHFAAPALAVDPRPGRGWLYLVYVRGGPDGTWDLVVAATKDRGKTWVRRRLGDDPPCALHMAPAAAVDPVTGQLHVAWYDSLGGGRFAHAACTAGAASCGARAPISDAPFALPLGLGAPGSVGERAGLAIDDSRRALHAVWAQPAVSGAARLLHARAPLSRR